MRTATALKGATLAAAVIAAGYLVLSVMKIGRAHV